MGFEAMSAPAAQIRRCLAAGQRVCTAKGAIAVEDLARAGFEAICFDSGTRRYVAKAAKAVSAGRKALVRLHTDKGAFDLTPDQTVVLQTGELAAAGQLTPGTRLCACAVKPEVGYLVTSADFGRERLDLVHLTEADCAIANWYPVPSVEALAEAEAYSVEIGEGALPNVVIWTIGPGGGIGIVVAA
ncbi:MAG TPA: hypothetical protein VKB84_13630 [Candidatus Binataceae bacterium]|nr:hypothetical protein [Candidatus Binataceae bacterium]